MTACARMRLREIKDKCGYFHDKLLSPTELRFSLSNYRISQIKLHHITELMNIKAKKNRYHFTAFHRMDRWVWACTQSSTPMPSWESTALFGVFCNLRVYTNLCSQLRRGQESPVFSTSYSIIGEYALHYL